MKHYQKCAGLGRDKKLYNFVVGKASVSLTSYLSSQPHCLAQRQHSGNGYCCGGGFCYDYL